MRLSENILRKFWVLLTCAVFVLAGLVSHGVVALSPEQRKAIDSGAKYYNLEATEFVQCGGGTVLTGSENAEKIWNFFINQGFSPPQAAGIMGNLQAESGFNPRRVQNTSTPEGDSDYITKENVGYGLAQWTTAGRQKGLADLAESRGVIHGDLATQLDYIMQELNGSYKNVQDKLRSTENVDEASDIIMVNYEGPKDQSESAKEKRRQFSRDILAQYGSTTPGPSSDTSTSTCGTNKQGEVVGDYSLPVDRHWYEDHPEWFSAPHHVPPPASDIPVPTGTAIYSMSSGTIVKAPTGGDCGEGLVIDAGDGVLFSYCHGSDGGFVSGAKEGDVVKAGQFIMTSANTGRSTGPHLHLAIQVNGEFRCPQPLFEGIANGSPPDPSSLPSSGCTQ